MNYLVSVIVPNYNHSKFLEQRIQSILNQTYKDFELILLDDCSPDNGASRAVIEKYRYNLHVSNIIYNEKNSGSSFLQWDKGINLAKGELIWIAESDDFCEPTLLDNLVKEFERDANLTLAYSLSRKVNVEGKPIKYMSYTKHGVTRLNGNNYILKYMTLDNHCKNASACLFKKSVYAKIDKLYTTCKAAGDKLFWIEIAEQGNVAIVNRYLNFFRQHNNKVTSSSYARGVNLKEAKIICSYIFLHHQLTERRKRLMYLDILYKIERSRFESEKVRTELMKYWEFNHPMSIIDRIQLRIILSLRRLSIYL